MDGRETIAYIVLEGQGLLTYRVKLADGSAETFASLDDVCEFAALHTVESVDVIFPDGDVQTFRRPAAT